MRSTNYASHVSSLPIPRRLGRIIAPHDCRAGAFYQYKVSDSITIRDFNAIPPLVIQSLLFIENRELLSNKGTATTRP